MEIFWGIKFHNNNNIILAANKFGQWDWLDIKPNKAQHDYMKTNKAQHENNNTKGMCKI